MRLISFKNTVLLKRGVWISAAALIAYAAAPSLLNGELWSKPLVSLTPLCILAGFWVYFLRKSAYYRLADQVIDCEDHLQVRRGRSDAIIPIANIAEAEVATYFKIHRIALRLRQPSPLGDRIDFLPQASLWGNLPAIQQLAARLTARALQSGGAGP
jgi:hypothetical protein